MLPILPIAHKKEPSALHLPKKKFLAHPHVHVSSENPAETTVCASTARVCIQCPCIMITRIKNWDGYVIETKTQDALMGQCPLSTLIKARDCGRLHFSFHALPMPCRRRSPPIAPPILFLALKASYLYCAASNLSLRAPIVAGLMSSPAFLSRQGREPMCFPVVKKKARCQVMMTRGETGDSLRQRRRSQHPPSISFHALRKS